MKKPFNPYEHFSFVDSHGYRVSSAKKVNLTLNGWVWAKNIHHFYLKSFDFSNPNPIT